MEFVNYMKSEGYEVRWRRTSSRDKKGVFYRQEEHVLERRKAWSWSLKSMCWKEGVRKMFTSRCWSSDRLSWV